MDLQQNTLGDGDPYVRIFDVGIVNLQESVAMERMHRYLQAGRRSVVFFPNAHTLNLASQDLHYREVLNSADLCMGDGVGVRLAASFRGVKMLANLNGTDLVPALLSESLDSECRYFMLGSDEQSIERASKLARQKFPGWTLVGYHHGYIDDEMSERVVEMINASGAQLLLVGMGNPLQEFWIARYRERLQVSLSIGVGGLLDYWAGNIRRAPVWMRRNGLEWFFILCQQLHKFRRYFVGGPVFIAKTLFYRTNDRRPRNSEM